MVEREEGVSGSGEGGGWRAVGNEDRTRPGRVNLCRVDSARGRDMGQRTPPVPAPALLGANLRANAMPDGPLDPGCGRILGSLAWSQDFPISPRPDTQRRCPSWTSCSPCRIVQVAGAILVAVRNGGRDPLRQPPDPDTGGAAGSKTAGDSSRRDATLRLDDEMRRGWRDPFVLEWIAVALESRAAPAPFEDLAPTLARPPGSAHSDTGDLRRALNPKLDQGASQDGKNLLVGGEFHAAEQRFGPQPPLACRHCAIALHLERERVPRYKARMALAAARRRECDVGR